MHFLNSGTGYALFEYEAQKDSYVDKSLLIDAVFQYARRTNKYICVTRPRRFGKSTAANMIAAFFDESTKEESRELFEELAIGGLKDEQDETYKTRPRQPLCWPRQGKLKVILINMINLVAENTKSYEDICRKLNRLMLSDLRQSYPELPLEEGIEIPEALSNTGDQFIFIIDEWDSVFELPFMTENNKRDYLLFLKALLKDQKYVYFAYMTGILPIAKYSSGSPLNMFEEF
ncbi:MAG: AAA family ATPase, partial [Lachnospiraceae bacterium]|nr:AAA family ATPase [Lachnospiraceae bacterium]